MPKLSRSVFLRWTIRLLVVGAAGASACVPGGIYNNTASLGGDTPGQRGSIRAIFINNTPFRAVFTYGVYDPQNPNFTPEFGQFSVNPDPTLRLEGNSESPTITFSCARAFSLGGAELIEMIKDAGLSSDLSEEALEPGIAFSDRALDDAEAGQATAGRAPEVIKLQGATFPCEALLVFRLELDANQASGFRVDMEVLPP